MLVTHIGHSCLLVETADARILFDPGAFTHGFEELTGLDAILITHAHVDHLDAERLPVLLEANDGARLIAEPEVAAELSRIGIDAAALHPGEQTSIAGLTLRAVGGQHALLHEDIPRIGNVGMLLGAPDGLTLFHPGDSYEDAPPGVDLLAVPLSAPWAALRETVGFVRAVRPAVAFPIHDSLLTPLGRGLYMRNLIALTPEDTSVRDLAGSGPIELSQRSTFG